jgi:hypothetical protein
MNVVTRGFPRFPVSSRTGKGPTATGRSPGSRVNAFCRLPSFPVAVGKKLAGHSCGNSAIFPMASLLSALSGRPVAGRRVADGAVRCKCRGKAASSVVRLRLTSAVLGALRISVANSSSRLRNGGLAGIRTRDLQIKSPLLYQLSYEPTYARWEAVPLCAATLLVKPCQQLSRGQMRHRVAPIGGDFAQGREDEAARAEFSMRDGEAGRGPDAAAPRDNVEIKRPIPPTTSGAATVRTFDLIELEQKLIRREIAF